MLKETLTFLSCEVCKKPQGLRRLPICWSCLKKLPQAKKLSQNVHLAFVEDVKLSFPLLSGLAASRYLTLGGKAEAVLFIEKEARLILAVAWFLNLPVVQIPKPNILIVKPIYEKEKILTSCQYLYVKDVN